MTSSRVTLHDVSVEGDGDHEQIIDAIERAVQGAAGSDATPSAANVRASIQHAVAGEGTGDR